MDQASRNQMSDLAAQAEGFLLAEGGPLSLKKLSSLLHAEQAAVNTALDEISSALEGSGLSLVRTGSEASLATSARVAPAVKQAFEDALAKEIGNAGLEVLAIVLYRGPSSRARIDYIRGVNTSSTVRLLLSRGLLERVPNPEDAREFLYRPTAALLAHLGAADSEALPDYGTIRAELAAFEATRSTFESDQAGAGDTEEAE